MNTKQSIILLIFFIFIFDGCSQNGNISKFNDFEKSVLPEAFAKFPIKENKDISNCFTMAIEFPDAYEYLGYCGISLVYEYVPAQFTEALKCLETNNIGVYDDQDSCILLIDDSTIKDCHQSNIKYYPIYNIYSTSISLNKNILSKNSLKYYVINCNEGKYLRSYDFEEKPKMLSQQFLSRTYQHGFSNGATVDIDKHRIVYWLLIW